MKVLDGATTKKPDETRLVRYDWVDLGGQAKNLLTVR